MIIKIKNTGKILEGVVFGENQKEGLFEFIEDLRLVRFVCDKKEADIYHSDAEVQKMIESAVAEHNQATKDTLQGYMDNEQQLLEQIEELKAKVPQPIEISRELAEEIESYYDSHSENWAYFMTERVELSKFNEIMSVIKNGYTVKTEPTLQNQIESILRALEYDFEGVESAAKEIVDVLKYERLIKDEEA